jgi:hypothetical protein
MLAEPTVNCSTSTRMLSAGSPYSGDAGLVGAGEQAFKLLG